MTAQTVLGLRIRMLFKDPDPGRETMALPDEWVAGTITGTHIGVHDRPHYYVTVDGWLAVSEIYPGRSVAEMVGEVLAGQLTGPWRARVEFYSSPPGRSARTTNIVSLCNIAIPDIPPPPKDLFAPELLTVKRTLASYADLVFRRPLPARYDLSDSQAEQHKHLVDRDFVYIGYAEVEVAE